MAIAPPAPGVTARVVDLGAKIELTNRTSTEVLVLGYEGEPYLRIGPHAVYENLHSQSTYINRTRLGGSVPVGVDTAPGAAPEWHKIGDGNSARWHDHRIHWMSAQPPPTVAADPARSSTSRNRTSRSFTTDRRPASRSRSTGCRGRAVSRGSR